MMSHQKKQITKTNGTHMKINNQSFRQLIKTRFENSLANNFMCALTTFENYVCELASERGVKMINVSDEEILEAKITEEELDNLRKAARRKVDSYIFEQVKANISISYRTLKDIDMIESNYDLNSHDDLAKEISSEISNRNNY